jgi:hypothetical protein
MPMSELNKSDKAAHGKIDTQATTSERGGLAGLLETALRKFRLASYLIALVPLYLIGILGMGISLLPGVYFANYIYDITMELPKFWHYLSISCGIIMAYFLYGLTLIFVMPILNFLMPFRLKPFRAGYYSLESVPWYFHNAFTYIVRYTFLEFITPTPLNMLFYRMMGMKIGKGAHINTTNISDPAMIEIGNYVTIGGSVHMIGHYASKGFLIVDKVKIKDRATIGLKATIMGNVEIGEGAAVGPHEVILPKSRIPAGRKPYDTDVRNGIQKDHQPSQDFPDTNR